MSSAFSSATQRMVRSTAAVSGVTPPARSVGTVSRPADTNGLVPAGTGRSPCHAVTPPSPNVMSANSMVALCCTSRRRSSASPASASLSREIGLPDIEDEMSMTRAIGSR